MKNKTLKTLSLATMFAGVSIMTPNAFAANPYGMDYTGGQELGESNVQIAPELIDGLTPLVKMGDTTTFSFSNNIEWLDAYMKSSNGDTCYPVKYFKIYRNGQLDTSNSPYFVMSNGRYSAKVDFKNVYLDNFNTVSEDGDFYPVIVSAYDGYIYASGGFFADATCETKVSGFKSPNVADDSKSFIETRIKLLDNETGNDFISNQLYFGIQDIDASQSFKILNESNPLTPSNMYARNASNLQPPDTDPRRNMFVEDGHYIYSQYDANGGFNLTSNSSVFTKISTNAQIEGLNIVYGFAGGAGSSLQYLAKQYTVSYASDEHGTVSGVGNEDIVAGHNPSGTEVTPDEHYEFSHWIADKDVVLADGTVITAGESLTNDQLRLVVVDEDITFTAINEAPEGSDEEKDTSTVAVPDTGGSTSSGSNAILLAGIILPSLIVAGAAFKHIRERAKSKVDFNK